jgi:anti-anti-sigma regulatory factor
MGSHVEDRPMVLLVEGSLDAKAGNKVKKFPSKVRRALRNEAVVDLRAARSATSEGWGALVSAVSSMSWAGSVVTVLLHIGLKGLAELSGLRRHARVVLFER